MMAAPVVARVIAGDSSPEVLAALEVLLADALAYVRRGGEL